MNDVIRVVMVRVVRKLGEDKDMDKVDVEPNATKMNRSTPTRLKQSIFATSEWICLPPLILKI